MIFLLITKLALNQPFKIATGHTLATCKKCIMVAEISVLANISRTFCSFFPKKRPQVKPRTLIYFPARVRRPTLSLLTVKVSKRSLYEILFAILSY